MYAILRRAATHDDISSTSWLVITDDDTLLRYNTQYNNVLMFSATE